jgi:phosphoglycerol geranylgeranyltransferase
MILVGPTESKLNDEVRRRGTVLACLIDPEDFPPSEAAKVAMSVQKAGASLILVGGSTVANQRQLDDVVIEIKRQITLPVILFPNNITGISQHADAILFTSLLNSNNPYFIVGAQALGALEVSRYNLEAIPMAYLVVGQGSTTAFVADVREIPPDKPPVAVMYSLAARYMGMRAVYLEAGSGSKSTVQIPMIQAVRKYFSGLLIVGGGITVPEVAKEMAVAGADILVVGNLLKSSDFITDIGNIAKAIEHRPTNTAS